MIRLKLTLSAFNYNEIAKLRAGRLHSLGLFFGFSLGIMSDLSTLARRN